MPDGMITQLIGLVLIYVFLFGVVICMDNILEADEKNKTANSTRTIGLVIFGGIVSTYLSNYLKALFNITFDFLDVTLTKQIVLGIAAICLISWLITKNRILKIIIVSIIIIVVITIFILP